MHIDIHTRFITLLGDPLAQSFAARMQNRGYEAAGLNLVYFYTVTGQAHLGEIIQGLRHMPFAGFAVTKPNKVKVLEYLDELDPLCAKMGSSNTVVKLPDGRLKGYNTDGVGFYRALDEAGVSVKEKTFFCIGSGGAGRAICSALAYHGAGRILIADLAEESARSLAGDINQNFAPVAEAIPYGDFSRVQEANAVINASGVGMGKTIGQTPLPPEYIRPGQFYFDACYNPDRTRFLENAEKAGCPVLNGLTMSLYQGTAQVELWSGQEAPVEAMRQELEKILAEKKRQE
ncbi:shikimate dehydrogenase [Acidaminococcus sp. DS4831]|uniref:shikimate dehydrogenase family protein n=1 Tax=Acidaminococcus sp. DS4831 TaxID=3141399 RepID=UPI0032E42222